MLQYKAISFLHPKEQHKMSLSLKHNQENSNVVQRGIQNDASRDPLSILSNNLQHIQTKNKKTKEKGDKPRKMSRRSVSFNDDNLIRLHKYPKNQTTMIRKEEAAQFNKPSFFIDSDPPKSEKPASFSDDRGQYAPKLSEQPDGDLTDNITIDMSITTKLFDDDDQDLNTDDSPNNCFTFSNFTLNTIPITSNLTGDSQGGSTSSSGVNCTELYSQAPNTESIFLNITHNATTKHVKTQEIFDNLNGAKNLLSISIPSNDFTDDIEEDTTTFFQDTLNLTTTGAIGSPILHTFDLQTIHPIKKETTDNDTLIIEDEQDDEEGTANFLLKGSTICLPDNVKTVVPTSNDENEFFSTNNNNKVNTKEAKNELNDQKAKKRSRLSVQIQENYNVDHSTKEEVNQQVPSSDEFFFSPSESSVESISVEDFLCLANVHFGNILLGRKTSVCPPRKNSYPNKDNVDPNGDMDDQFTSSIKEKLCYQAKFELLAQTNAQFEREIKEFQQEIGRLTESLSKHNPECFASLLKPKSKKVAIQMQTQLKRLKQTLKTDSKLTWYSKNKECSLNYQKYIADALDALKLEKIRLLQAKDKDLMNESVNGDSLNETDKKNNEKFVNELEEQVEKDSDLFQILKGFHEWKLITYQENQIVFDFPYSYRLTVMLSRKQMTQISSISFEKTAKSTAWKDLFVCFSYLVIIIMNITLSLYFQY